MYVLRNIQSNFVANLFMTFAGYKNSEVSLWPSPAAQVSHFRTHYIWWVQMLRRATSIDGSMWIRNFYHLSRIFWFFYVRVRNCSNIVRPILVISLFFFWSTFGDISSKCGINTRCLRLQWRHSKVAQSSWALKPISPLLFFSSVWLS